MDAIYVTGMLLESATLNCLQNVSVSANRFHTE